MKYNLGINTGFAVNRFCELKELFNFIRNDLKIKNVQLSADLLSPFYDKSLLKNKSESINQKLKKFFICFHFYRSFTRLNHLAHTDRDIQRYWITWFKTLIDISSELECENW